MLTRAVPAVLVCVLAAVPAVAQTQNFLRAEGISEGKIAQVLDPTGVAGSQAGLEDVKKLGQEWVNRHPEIAGIALLNGSVPLTLEQAPEIHELAQAFGCGQVFLTTVPTPEQEEQVVAAARAEKGLLWRGVVIYNYINWTNQLRDIFEEIEEDAFRPKMVSVGENGIFIPSQSSEREILIWPTSTPVPERVQMLPTLKVTDIKYLSNLLVLRFLSYLNQPGVALIVSAPFADSKGQQYLLFFV